MAGPDERQAPPEDDQPTSTEASDETDSLKSKIALTLATLVVLGAGLAVLEIDASTKESNTARETTRTAVRAMRANVVADTVAGLAPVLQSERDFMPFRRPLDASAPSLAAAAGAPARPGLTEGSLRVAQQAVPQLEVTELLPSLETKAQRLTLKQRALAAPRIAWNDRATQYTTVIAVIAVALFLVGFGLVVEKLIRRAAYVVGVAVGLFALGWAVWIFELPIPSTPGRAINAAASGAVLTATGSYDAALADYNAALEADRTYATAYAGRSRARLLAVNPDYPETRGVVDSGGPAFAGAALDARRAFGLNDRDILSTALLALTSFYRGQYAAAADAVDAAIEINPKVADLWVLKSANEVALGNRAAADAAFDRALSVLRGSEPSQRTRLLAATYLSYLAWVERYAPGQAAEARRLANRTVSVETSFTLGRTLRSRPPTRGKVSVQGLRFAHGKLMLRLLWKNLPPGTALTALEYERPLRRGAWTQPISLALFATVDGSGRRDISVPLERVCKPTRVRVDVYLNGAGRLTRTGPGVAPTC